MYSVSTNKLICEAYKRHEAANGKFTVCQMGIELTRRCNLSCAHCMKGDAQNNDIHFECIDALMRQVGLIYCLALFGGEITLCPDRFRYVLESAKRHNVRIKRLVVITNGVIKSKEFLEIYQAFSEYTEMPGLNEIIISKDIFHSSTSRLTEEDYQDRKTFFGDNGKNHIIFQNVCAGTAYNLKRVGRCAEMPNFHNLTLDTYTERVKAFFMAERYPLLKQSLRGIGKHICVLQLTATGYLLPSDIISYIDEDKSQYNNGHIYDILTTILRMQNRDPYLNSVGKFMCIAKDFDSIVTRFKNEIGFAGLGLLFMGNKKRQRLKEICFGFSEIVKSQYDLLPAVKDWLDSPEISEYARKFLSDKLNRLEIRTSEIEKAIKTLNSLTNTLEPGGGRPEASQESADNHLWPLNEENIE